MACDTITVTEFKVRRRSDLVVPSDLKLCDFDLSAVVTYSHAEAIILVITSQVHAKLQASNFSHFRVMCVIKTVCFFFKTDNVGLFHLCRRSLRERERQNSSM